MLRDRGAVADLTDSLAEGLARYVDDVSARLPRARVVLQLDEPSLVAVLTGGIPTESGFSRYPAVERSVVREHLSRIIATVGVPVVVHCCAQAVPVTLLHEAGAEGVALDMSLLDLDSPTSDGPAGRTARRWFHSVRGSGRDPPGAGRTHRSRRRRRRRDGLEAVGTGTGPAA